MTSKTTRTNSKHTKPPFKTNVIVHGVEVEFPYPTVYPPQLAVMNAVIKTLQAPTAATQMQGTSITGEEGQFESALPSSSSASASASREWMANVALIEAPTGTGKTLALLTSALAWQRQWRATSSPQVPVPPPSQLPQAQAPSPATAASTSSPPPKPPAPPPQFSPATASAPVADAAMATSTEEQQTPADSMDVDVNTSTDAAACLCTETNGEPPPEEYAASRVDCNSDVTAAALTSSVTTAAAADDDNDDDDNDDDDDFQPIRIRRNTTHNNRPPPPPPPPSNRKKRGREHTGNSACSTREPRHTPTIKTGEEDTSTDDSNSVAGPAAATPVVVVDDDDDDNDNNDDDDFMQQSTRRPSRAKTIVGKGKDSSSQAGAKKKRSKPSASASPSSSSSAPTTTTATTAAHATVPNASAAASTKPPTIFYATRTHAQVKKAIDELRRTCYRPSMTTLASRDSYCINSQVMAMTTTSATAAVSGTRSRDAECKRLIREDPPLCEFKARTDRLAEHPSLRGPGGSLQVWDVEDLVQLGKREHSCPYFTSRALARHRARLVFCPYNYLIDGGIRDSMGISLKNSVVIIDEAHNVEDVCRDSASFDLREDSLANLIHEFERLLLSSSSSSSVMEVDVDIPAGVAIALAPLVQVFTGLHTWLRPRIEHQLQPRQDQFEVLANTWAADALRDMLATIHVSTANIDYLIGCWINLLETYPHLFGAEPQVHILSSHSIVVLEGILRTLQFLVTDDMQFLSAYRLVIERTPLAAAAASSLSPTISSMMTSTTTTNSSTSPATDQDRDRRRWDTRISFWCMSGAAAFRPILRDARAIVLVSGTLAPFPALRAELGILNNSSRPAARPTSAAAASSLAPTELQSSSPASTTTTVAVPDCGPSVLQLTTGHVLADEARQLVGLRINAFVRRYPHNPSSTSTNAAAPSGGTNSSSTSDSATVVPLRLDFKTQENVEVQDAYGETLLSICQAIPDGVLCFLPSYSLVDKLVKRWQATGLYFRLAQLKKIVREPRGSSSASSSGSSSGGPDFAANWKAYLQAINRGKGALFLAVCRGKVSEGMDFADAAARAVVVIGIPYPFVKDFKVSLKKEYNTQTRLVDSHVLSGNDWYSLSAFRALNQALGRVIRHRYDYGAIILMDQRFDLPAYTDQLSTWVRRALAPPLDSFAAGARLTSFFAQHKT